MSLNETLEIVEWPRTHYVFVEKVGPFMVNAPAAWQAAHGFVPALLEKNRITRYMTLYDGEKEIYRAGFALDAPPVELPEGLAYEEFAGGKYSKFVVIGPYTQLPHVSGRVWEIAKEKPIALRDAFAIENYVSDPRVTPEEELVTEILVPTA